MKKFLRFIFALQPYSLFQGVRTLLRSCWPLGFYIGLVIVFTWPALGRLDSHILGTESDAYVHLWTFHWVEDILRSKQFTFDTKKIFFPHGVSLLNHNIAWLNVGIWWLLKQVVGNMPAYSLGVLLVLTINGYAAYLLAKETVGSKNAALLAGVIGTTWLFITTRLHHPNLIFTGFISLGLLYIGRFIKTGLKKDFILSVVFISFIGVVRLQLLAMSFFLIVPYILYQLAISRQLIYWRRLGQLLLLCILVLVILIPFVAPIAIHQMARTAPVNLLDTSSTPHTTDLLNYLLPNPFHPLWGTYVRTLVSIFSIPFHVPFIGFTVLFISGVGLIKQTKQAAIWGGLALVFLLFSVGPVPDIGGQQYFTLPYKWLYKQILVPIFREPDRFNVLLAIPCSNMAALGVDYLEQKIHSPRFKILGLSLIAALIMFEYAMWPFPGKSLWVPNWHVALAEEKEQFGILEIPMDRSHDEKYMLYQLAHGKSLVEGHVSRPPDQAFAFINEVPLLAHLRRGDGRLPPTEDMLISQQLDQLQAANIRYLVLHQSFLSELEIDVWRKWLIFAPAYEDDEVIIYRTDTVEIADYFADQPKIGDNIQLVRADIVPAQTIQTGWFELMAYWFVPDALANRDNDLCLALVDRDMRFWQHDCGYRVFDAPALGAESPGLLLKKYLIQVESTTDVGEYKVVIYQRPATIESLPAVTVVAGELTVSDFTRSFQKPTPSEFLDVSYGTEIALIGYDVERDGSVLQLNLYWHALQKPEASYKFFVHIVSESSGVIVDQKDYFPRDWLYPTNLWESGEFVDEEILFDLTDVPSGTYLLQVGLYDAKSGLRLRTMPGTPENSVLLTTIVVAP